MVLLNMETLNPLHPLAPLWGIFSQLIIVLLKGETLNPLYLIVLYTFIIFVGKVRFFMGKVCFFVGVSVYGLWFSLRVPVGIAFKGLFRVSLRV